MTETIAEGEIHIYYAELNRPEPELNSLAGLLDDQETARAKRFKFDIHRRRLIARRGLLRQLLARYTGQDPAAIRYTYGHREKPALADSTDLQFNVSDSQDLAAYAITRGVEIGVDVEILRPMPDAISISEHYFSDPEREDLRSVGEEETAEAFFNCWTRKEAYLKAIGEGLAEPLNSFVVTLRPGEAARFLEFKKVPHEVDSWELHHLRPSPESVGALALRQRGVKIVEAGWL